MKEYELLSIAYDDGVIDGILKIKESIIENFDLSKIKTDLSELLNNIDVSHKKDDLLIDIITINWLIKFLKGK